MVNPVNGDKPISTTIARSDSSSRRTATTDQVTGQAGRSEQKAANPASSTLEIDNGRQLYQMESQRSASIGPTIETPEEARSLLNQILSQIGQAPEQALKSQASATASPLANLLETAPA